MTTTASDLIRGGTSEADIQAQILNAVAHMTEAVSAMQTASALMTDALAKLMQHSRVMADDATAGHFRPGLGFEFDPKTGRHNATGTAAFEDALTRLRWTGPAPATPAAPEEG